MPPRLVTGRTGVFVDTPDGKAAQRKIASIGVGARGWITSHGFALNVDLDLAGFANIVACGLADVRMTSVAAELGTRRSRGSRAARARGGRRCVPPPLRLTRLRWESGRMGSNPSGRAWPPPL